MENRIQSNLGNDYKIIVVDNQVDILNSLSVFLNKLGYSFTGVTDPIEAINLISKEHFDMMILDFIMTPINGDKIVEEIRKFNKELYILLLIGPKDLAPPLETIKRLDIQGYCEKSDNFDQLILLLESGMKTISQTQLIKNINSQLQETYTSLEQAYFETIQTLKFSVEAKDAYTRGHSDRVSEYSTLIGKELNLSQNDLKILRIGGLFHDIGKIGIPDAILLKDSKLSSEEYSEIKKHPSIGSHILSNSTIFKDIIPIVKYHHERYDGLRISFKIKGQFNTFIS